MCLAEIDGDGDLSSQRRLIERRLAIEAEKYMNCSVPSASQRLGGIKEWHFTKQEAEMVHIAMKLSDTAYDTEREPELEEAFRFEKKYYIPASVNGTTKATTFTIVTRENASSYTETEKAWEEDKGEFPLLIIAIKGSKSPTDWMVNTNGTPQSVGDFFNLTHMHPPTRQPPASIQAHSGFLHCAHALLPQITRELHKLIKEYNIHNVLLTGHSAGGAVSSLLFTYFLSISHQEYKNIKFSLITFGAPPVTSPDITPLLLRYKSPNKGFSLAICNEYDPVPRADLEYIRSLLDLHRSAYGLPPLRIPELSNSISVTEGDHSVGVTPISPTGTTLMDRTPTDISTTPTATTSAPPESPCSLVTPAGEWILPIAVLHPLGRLIVLKDRNADEETMDLYAYEVKAEEFEKLLFVKAGAHRRGVYLENLEQVRNGWVNGRQGWDQ